MNRIACDNSNLKMAREQEALLLYYEKLFPHDLIYKWLSYGDPLYFLRREIAFVLGNNRYLRYMSFQTDSELLRCFLEKVPSKMEIGCVYDVPPQDHALASACTPMEKELVFDIDMTDYDEIRSCCSEANVCNKCWKFLSIACKILDATLREDFGFEHVLWVFSGRRGIHCWVCDQSAKNLSNDERQSILSYINLIQGNANISRRVKLPPKTLHNSIERALNIVNENFVEFIIVEQDILGDDDKLKKFLHLLWDLPPNDFKQLMSVGNTSLERWKAFVSHLETLIGNDSLPQKFKYLKEEIILHLTYPRLDTGVTKRLDHLLKSPFCIHPKTGKVCVPFLANMVDDFNVNQVPTISLLLDELNDFYQKLSDEKKMAEYNGIDKKYKTRNLQNTSLLESYNIFRDFVIKLETGA